MGRKGDALESMDSERANTVILLVTNLDDDDFSAIVDNLILKDNILLISDKSSIKGYKKRSINYLVDNLKDIDKVVERIRVWSKKNKRRFIRIIGLDEEYHYRLSERIAREFDLPYHSRKTLDACSNKFLQKELLKMGNVRTPKYQIFKNGETTDVGFPNVLKPITGYASSFVYLNQNEKELKKNLSTLKRKSLEDPKDPIFKDHIVEGFTDRNSFNPRTEYMIEEFIGGVEYSCDFIVSEGMCRVVRVVRKIESQRFIGMFRGFYLFNPDESNDCGFNLGELEDFCKSVASSLDIKEGVCMMDFKCFNDELVVIEATVRPGVSTFIDMMFKIYEYTSINLFIRTILGEKLECTIPSATGLTVYFYVDEGGILKTFDTSYFENRWHELGLLEISKYHPVGKRIHTKWQKSQLGYIIFRDILEDRINEYVALVKEKTVIEMAKEED